MNVLHWPKLVGGGIIPCGVFLLYGDGYGSGRGAGTSQTYTNYIGADPRGGGRGDGYDDMYGDGQGGGSGSSIKYANGNHHGAT